MTTTPSLWRSGFIDNQTLTGQQDSGVVATTGDDQFFAVWVDHGIVIPGQDVIMARKFDSLGNPVTAEVDLTNPPVVAPADEPAAVRLPIPGQVDGLAVVADVTVGGFLGQIEVNRTNAALTKLEPVIAVDLRAIDTDHPSITSFSNGSLLVGYTAHNTATDWGIEVKSVSPTGVVTPGSGVPGTVIFDNGLQSDNSDLTTLANGNAVIVFQDQQLSNPAIHDTLFAITTPTGATVVAPMGVNGGSNPAADETTPHVAALADGGFVVSWTNFTTHQIGAAVYDASGTVVHGNILANFFDPSTFVFTNDVTALPDGGFVVAWEDVAAGVDRAQRFDETGNLDGTSIVFSPSATFNIDAATLSDGRSILTINDFFTNPLNLNDVVSSIWDTRATDANQVTGDNFIGPGGGTSDMLIIANHNSIRTADALQIENGNLQSSTVIAITGSNVSFDGAGDFNHDGLSDLLAHTDNLSNGVRTLFAYQMTPVGPGGTSTVANLGNNWIVDATGDFNGDGTSDILLHRDSGTTRTFEVLSMKNFAVQSAPIVQVTGVDWNVDGTGDFNGNGTSDILEHRIVGGNMNVQVVTLQNNVVQSVSLLANIGSDWQIDGTGDFNHNGTSDILMHRDSGNVRTFEILTINNNTIVGANVVAQTGTNFQVAGIGDFNHDGTTDIAMHADTGTTRNDWIFGIANNVLQNAHIVATTGIDWHVA
jgi:hypothetical protein